MRTEQDVIDYAIKIRQSVYNCKKCKGENLICSCYNKAELKIQAFEACIPKDFWFIKEKNVKHNLRVFKKVVKKYVKRIDIAFRNGYGLVFLGNNGVGKTYFFSYILMWAIRKGRTSYYTTLPQLDYNIKSGFKDSVIEKRLEYMLTSDFLVIDEMGKEHIKKTNDSVWLVTQVERILKQRCDDGLPTLLATNMSPVDLIKSYGNTVSSILQGKCKFAQFDGGDFRSTMKKKMNKEMEF